jgi:hypothetical protein
MNRKFTKPVAGLLLIGALSMTGLGFAAAQQTDPAADPAASLGLPGLFEQGGRGGFGQPGEGRGPGGRGGHGGREVTQALVAQLSETTGLATADIAARVAAGETLAAIIEAEGGDVEAFTNSVVALLTEQIDHAVASGRLTAAQAEARIAELPARVTAVLSGEAGGRWLSGRGIGAEVSGRRIVLSLLADTLAAQNSTLTVRDLRDLLASGETLQSILDEAGIDAAAFVDDAVARYEARVNVAVVDGTITPESAQALVEAFRAELETQLNEAPAI